MKLIGRVARWLIGPWGRRAMVLLAVGVLWAWWADAPLRPLTAWTSPQTDGTWNPIWPRISRDGSTFIEISKQLPLGTDPFENGSMAGPVRLWDLPAGRERVSIPGFGKAELRAVLGPDGSWVMIWTPFHAGLTLWDGITGKLRAEMRPPDEPDFSNLTSATPFLASSDGKFVAAVVRQKPHVAIRVWESATGRLVAELAGARPPFAFSPDGRQMLAATAGLEGRPGTVVKLWDIATSRELFSLSGRRWPVASVAFSPDGRLLATVDTYFHPPDTTGDQDVKLWDANTGRPVQSFAAKAGLSLQFSPDSRLLLVWKQQARGIVWDITKTPPQNRDDLIALTDEIPNGVPCLNSYYGPHYAPSGGAWYVTDKDGTAIAASGEPCESPRPLALPSLFGAASRIRAGVSPETPVFSQSGNVLAVPVRVDVPDYRSGPYGLLDRILRRPVSTTVWSTVAIYDPISCRMLGTLPPVLGECYVLGFTPDSQTFWTQRLTGDRQSSTRVFEQWPVPSPGVRWWLFAATALGLLFAVADWWRGRRISAPKGRHNLAQGVSPGSMV